MLDKLRAGNAFSGKVIGSAADLAIHGAPPAFFEPLHVGRPDCWGPRRVHARGGCDVRRQQTLYLHKNTGFLIPFISRLVVNQNTSVGSARIK